jgi:lipopolysaccharide/colanic/teichoic acid biosynthesis glycosyltransferase
VRSEAGITCLDTGLKRLLDVCLSGAGLVLSLPLWGLIALAIKLEDRGPVLYPQRRVGKDGRIFNCLKFRSMVVDLDRAGALPTSVNDPRITFVGRALRATAMDELPQLWNIFRGDMSFVGPRPEWEELVVEFRKEIAGFDRRHVIRPGLTGLAQVCGHADISRRKKLRYDLLYIKRRSFWFDLKLICRSFVVTFLGQWEHRGPKLIRRRLHGQSKESEYCAREVASRANGSSTGAFTSGAVRAQKNQDDAPGH